MDSTRPRWERREPLGTVEPVERPPEDFTPTYARGIAVDDNGYTFVTGTKSANAGDILTVIYSPQYYPAMVRTFASPEDGFDEAADVVVCRADGVSWAVVIGTATDEDEDDLEFVLLRYDIKDTVMQWAEQTPMPVHVGNDIGVGRGGWLAADTAAGLIYAARGKKTLDFYRYDPSGDTWTTLTSILPGAESKLPEKGCRGVCDGNGHVYMTKGNNTFGFWSYDIAASTWAALADVPAGPTGKRVKGGTDLAYVEVNDTGFVYLLKGYKCEFWRYNTIAGTWQQLADAPTGIKEKWDKGSWIVYDGANTIYAHKAKYYVGTEHELWSYDIALNQWSSSPLRGMPLYGLHSGKIKKKKAKDGGGAAWVSGMNWIFALKGGNTQQVWRYEVAADSWCEADTLPQVGSSGKKKRVSLGGDLVHTGEGTLYALKGNKTLQMWRYGPVAACGAPRFQGWHSGIGTSGCRAGGGKDDEQVIAEGYDAHRPQWHNSGQLIVYTREDDDGVEQVYVSDAAGQNEWQQTFGEAGCENPVFDPKGGVILFQQEDTSSGCWQVAVVQLDLSGGYDVPPSAPVEPLPVTAPIALRPALQTLPVAAVPTVPKRKEAPKTFAVQPAEVAPVESEVVQAPAGGLDAEPQVLTSDDFDHENPKPSLDGRWAIYQKDDETGYTQLYRIRSGGGEEEALTDDDADHEDPQYLTDSTVVYTRSEYGEYDHVYVLNLTTMTQSPLTESDYDHGHPAPSPDGCNVMFEVEDDYGMTQVGRVSASGGDEDCLTEEEIDLETPTWSPDNQTVFCVGWRYPGTEIGLVTTTGYEAVTDSEVIRLNPDVFYNGLNSQQLIVFERETWDTSGMDGNGRPGPRRRHPGRGIFLIRVSRRPGDGVQTGEAFKLALERIRPNPAAGQLSLRWQVPSRDRVTVQAFDVTGRVVRTLCDEELAPGVYDCRWDCTDEAGRKLPAGVYFFSLSSAGKEMKQKVVLQR